MKMPLTFTPSDRSDWHHWLEEHGCSEKEVWLIFYKKESGQPILDYEDALEEALCFGWVDSLIQKIDDFSYARKFTPRTNLQKWSASNLRRMQKLIAAGKMTAAGLQVIDPAILAKSPQELERQDDPFVFEQIKTTFRQSALA